MSTIQLWHLGNTTVRTPFRLREGLLALSSSTLQGNLRGRQQEIALRDLLGEHDIVELGNDDTYSVGRKWRSALSKLGFLYPKIPSGSGIDQNEIGPIDTITPNGLRLIRADTVPAMQECFLRSLAAHYIPSVLEKSYSFSIFSPLRHTLAIMRELEKLTGESTLHFIEMALVVQLTNSDEGIANIVKQILKLRDRREKTEHKRRFDGEEYEAAAKLYEYVPTTFIDYADTNFRYLKATGLVQNKGRGLSLIPGKHIVIEQLIQDRSIPDSSLSYLSMLCNGAVLPTDNKDAALEVLRDLLDQLKERNLSFDLRNKPLDSPPNIALVRHELEELLLRFDEEEYANQQINQGEEIVAYIELIERRGRSTLLTNGEEIRLPGAEAAAYLEWVLWRSFLAIDSLQNKPYEARRFKIDQDFFPINTAPGNGPDMVFEFADYVLVVEVTLTENSRQEAAEGETVRRHVAELMQYHQSNSNKPVYGLFIAKRIDSNTAETFRNGRWFGRDNQKMQLNIVPITLEQFKKIFIVLLGTRPIKVNVVREIIDHCVELRSKHDEGPRWKEEIRQVVDQYTI